MSNLPPTPGLASFSRGVRAALRGLSRSGHPRPLAASESGQAGVGSIRVGTGFDLHRMRKGRPFVLAGIRIPHPSGPDGHSDADPLSHAIVDALLGAAALGDIGDHFSDADPRWRGVPGPEFLRRTRDLLKRRGFVIVNVDATLLCERPKLGPHKRAVAAAVARALGVPIGRVNVKAKTMEGLGDIGAGRALAAQAAAAVRVT